MQALHKSRSRPVNAKCIRRDASAPVSSVSSTHVRCCFQACAGSGGAVPRAGPGSMVKAHKSAGRKSSHCHRTQVHTQRHNHGVPPSVFTSVSKHASDAHLPVVTRDHLPDARSHFSSSRAAGTRRHRNTQAEEMRINWWREKRRG